MIASPGQAEEDNPIRAPARIPGEEGQDADEDEDPAGPRGRAGA